MTRQTSPVWLTATLLAVAVVSVPACDVVFQDVNAVKVTDQWKRSYALAEGGQVEISNLNGSIEVTSSTGATVDVVADLTAHGASDQVARDLLKGIRIQEQAAPDRIRIEVPRVADVDGFGFGAGRTGVSFKVAVPRAARVKLATRNGTIRVSNIAGAVSAESINGAVTGTGLSGAVNASTTNGTIAVEVTRVTAEGVRLETTNGPIELKLPADGKANISARWVHGSFSTSGLSPVGETDQRRYAGTLNGGGPPIELTTINGGIRIRSSADKQ